MMDKVKAFLSTHRTMTIVLGSVLFLIILILIVGGGKSSPKTLGLNPIATVGYVIFIAGVMRKWFQRQAPAPAPAPDQEVINYE